MTDSFRPPPLIESLPILPLRNSVLFPASVVPINVGRARSVRLIEEAFGSERPTIGVVAQKGADTEDPRFDEIFQVGTVARVLKVIRLSSGNYSVVLQGMARMKIEEELARHPFMHARVSRIDDRPFKDVEIDALTVHLRESARKLLALLPHPPREASAVLDNVQDPGALADLVASNLPISTLAKQGVLETFDLRTRLRKVVELVTRQSEVFRVKKEISTMVQEEMSRSQREFLLRQQARAIRKELGETEDDEDEIESLRERIVRAEMTTEAEKAAKKQLSRMRNMSPAGAEYQSARTYVEWLSDIPWSRSTPDRLDVTEVRRVLDEDHHGLDLVKKRIVEYIAIRKLRSDKKGPIICLVGPPGVGKTSLGRSIARATGRQFVRISLGGVSDESEIRGHRRTYVGSFPGRIIGGLKKAQARNPVMVLDEVDKLGNDSRGDPASALLEVLDPEQNSAFNDHYLEVPVDLSQVMFIATANREDTIPWPLLDRMEIINIPGYTRDEKKAIARDFLIPRQLSEHGITPDRLEFPPEAIEFIVDGYTREAGVRNLERQVASICRAVAVRLAGGEDVYIIADPKWIEETLGATRHENTIAEKLGAPGIATGLSWTPAGGDLMFIEASKMPGRGMVHLTGSMGDVLKESVAAAFTYIRTRASSLGLSEDFLSKLDVHVHLPAGGMPIDGPSAGLAIFVALASMLTRIKVRPDVAVSGEITLRGTILAVEGIKEKCLAAHRAGIKHVVLPKRNEPDIEEVPDNIRRDLIIHWVSKVDEVLALTLEIAPAPPPAEAASPAP
ncbi:MAG: endopeptidase La [Sandaracinaceae bacterium]|jgi:ATP-dependent Lon protease|nr:endopeptidase La [Sandaracinaceae bacterium]